VNALAKFVPSPALVRFDRDDAVQIAIRAANGAGKTQHIARKIARAAVGMPRRRFRVMGPTHSQTRNVIGRYLWQFLAPYCDPRSIWRAGTGWNLNNTVLLANGAEIEVRSYEDNPQSHEGPHDFAIIGLDEVPPQAHYWANKGRGDQLILGFTVQEAPPLWLREEVEGPPPWDSPTSGRTEHDTGWVQYVVPFLRQNVPWYDDAKYQQKAGKYIGTEYEQTRVNAAWETTSEIRVFTGWHGGLVKTREEIAAMLRLADGTLHVDGARYGISHGTGEAQYQTLVLQAGSRWLQVAEHIGGPRDQLVHHAHGIRKALEAWLCVPGKPLPAWLTDGGGRFRVHGDRQYAGPGGGGDAINRNLEQALAQAYGRTDAPLPIRAPAKQKADKGAGELALNHAMLEGRWFVLDECREAIRAYQQYEGKASDIHRGRIDAAVYAVGEEVLLRRRPHTGTQIQAH
jgi:hypothetical protein